MADSVQITLGANVAGALAGLASFTRAAQVAGAAFVAAFTEGTRRAINFADEIGKAAQKAGVAVDEFSKLAYVGQQAGIEIDGLKGAFKNLSQAMQESGRVFDEIGVSRYGAGGGLRSAVDVMEDIADVFQAMPDGARKTTLAVQLFGKAGQDLIPILNAGRDGIRAQKKEAEELGVVVSRDLAAKADEFNSNLTRIGQGLKGLFLSVANQALPMMNTVAEKSVSLVKALNAELKQYFADVDKLFKQVNGSSQLAGYSGLVGGSLKDIKQPALPEIEYLTDEAEIRLRIQRNELLFADQSKRWDLDEEQRHRKEILYLEQKESLYRKLALVIDPDAFNAASQAERNDAVQTTKEDAEIQAKLIPVLREKAQLTERLAQLRAQAPAGNQGTYSAEDLALLGSSPETFSDKLAKGLGETTRYFTDFSSRAAEAITNGVMVAVDGLSDAITGLIQGTRNWADVWRSVTSNILGMVVQLIVRFTVLAGLVSLLGFLFPGSALVGQFTKFAGFASGGFTGAGPTDQVAGVVHKGEYVVNASTLQRLGVGSLDSMQAGYTPSIATPAYGAGGQGGGSKVSIGFINGPGQMADWLQSGDGRKVLIDVMSQEIHHFRG